jgi:hypothetical protein
VEVHAVEWTLLLGVGCRRRCGWCQGLERREARLAYIDSLLARQCSEVLLEQDFLRLV